MHCSDLHAQCSAQYTCNKKCTFPSSVMVCSARLCLYIKMNIDVLRAQLWTAVQPNHVRYHKIYRNGHWHAESSIMDNNKNCSDAMQSCRDVSYFGNTTLDHLLESFSWNGDPHEQRNTDHNHVDNYCTAVCRYEVPHHCNISPILRNIHNQRTLISSVWDNFM